MKKDSVTYSSFQLFGLSPGTPRGRIPGSSAVVGPLLDREVNLFFPVCHVVGTQRKGEVLFDGVRVVHVNV